MGIHQSESGMMLLIAVHFGRMLLCEISCLASVLFYLIIASNGCNNVSMLIVCVHAILQKSKNKNLAY
jgi:hypothetical protein